MDFNINVKVTHDVTPTLLSVLTAFTSGASSSAPVTEEAPKKGRKKQSDHEVVETAAPEQFVPKTEEKTAKEVTAEEIREAVIKKRQENEAVNKDKIKAILFDDFMVDSLKELQPKDFAPFLEKLKAV